MGLGRWKEGRVKLASVYSSGLIAIMDLGRWEEGMARLAPIHSSELITIGKVTQCQLPRRRPRVSAVKKKPYVISGSVSSRVKSSFIVFDILQ